MDATPAARRPAWLLKRSTGADGTATPQAQAAFADLYQSYGARVYAFVRFRVGDPTVAEDLTAEVFARAWAKLDGWRSPEAAVAWLFVTARRLTADYHRRRDVLPLTAVPPERHPLGPSPEEELLLAERVDRLGRGLATLSAREREVVGLRFVAGLRHREIARIVGTSENNVATIVHRAVAKLRRRLLEEEPADV